MGTFIRHIYVFLIATFMVASLAVNAGDAESRQAYEEGIAAGKAGKFKDAADKFEAAELYADDIVLKANATKKAADAYRKCGLRYKEFEALEHLLNGFPSNIDFQATVQREYEIATEFYQGKRDSALSWMPWIKDKDRGLEACEAVLKHAPFAKFAPELRLRLGKLYIEADKIDDAIRTFRELVKLHPDAEEARFGEFELANILIQKAKRGDGDGAFLRQAHDCLTKIIEKYAKAPEIPWAKESLVEINDIAAKRLYGLASFYRRQENDEAAERYCRELLTTYPDSDSAKDTEKLLAEINSSYQPNIEEEDKEEVKEEGKVDKEGKESKPGKLKKKKKVERKYGNVAEIPPEPEKIMIVPENSGGKWLIPIEDLGLGDKKKVQDGNTDNENTQTEGKLVE